MFGAKKGLILIVNTSALSSLVFLQTKKSFLQKVIGAPQLLSSLPLYTSGKPCLLH